MLFEYYDTSNDGRINYKEFSTMLAGPPAENPAKLAAAYNQPKYNKKEEVKPERNGPADDIDSLIKLFRSKIMGRGARGIVGIQRIFKIMDDDNSRTLSLAEFTKAVKDFKVGVSEENCPVLFDAFDLNRDGTLNIDEFLMAIRGEMNQKRVAQVEKAFRKIDKDGNGLLEVADIKDSYKADRHPDVLQGKKTDEQVLLEFLETFEAHHAMRMNEDADGKVNLEEFVEYYKNISCSIDDDAYFALMINNSWNVTGDANTYTTYKKSVKVEEDDNISQAS